MGEVKKGGHDPLIGVIFFVLLGVLLGLSLGLYLGYRGEQEVLRRYGGNPVVIDASDGYPWFLFLGSTVGGFVGLAIGIARYVVVKRAESESHLRLGLRSK
jgi:hypothetical protein